MDDLFLRIGCRGSHLSLTQVEEIARYLRAKNIQLTAEVHTFATTGDKDLLTSLKDLGKTDFFTKEIDVALEKGDFDIAVHAAKDLPEPLPDGLVCAYLSKSIDTRDVLVLCPNYEEKKHPIVGVSSERREKMVLDVWKGAHFKEIRGTIEHRLLQLDSGEYDAIVVAEAALIRLGLTGRSRIYLYGATAEHQGRLAVVCRKEDASLYTSIFEGGARVAI